MQAINIMFVIVRLVILVIIVNKLIYGYYNSNAVKLKIVGFSATKLNIVHDTKFLNKSDLKSLKLHLDKQIIFKIKN